MHDTTRPSTTLLDGLRRLLSGDREPLRFSRCEDFSPPPMEGGGLYVHVPFCRSLCPYCPYVRGPYRPADAGAFCSALVREMDWYRQRLGHWPVGSVYFGGGTPTVIGPRLLSIVDDIRQRFAPSGPFCIESHPADLGPARARLLADAGFESVSVGVQSFDPAVLAFLGRAYAPDTARRSLDALAACGIPSINVDLMFAIPGQDPDSWQRDIDEAAAGPAQQVTAYPLFTFPYAEVGSQRASRRLQMPPWRLRRRMYYQLYDSLVSAGFRRVSVWSFQRGEGPRFSSVTRRRYLGLGPSAGSCYGSVFTLNTFSLGEYCGSVARRGHAVALTMPMAGATDDLMDLYWRAYDTRIEAGQWERLASSMPRLRPGLAAARALGLCEREAGGLALTRRGSFWLHLLQNQVALPGVAALWAAGKQAAWPAGVTLH